MSSYTLEYFPLRGRGELARMIMMAGDIKFENKLIQFSEWPEHKKNTPLGTMPVLEIDGDVRLSQSGAIARYLANEAGLAGKSLRQKAVLDMMYETLYEILFKLPLSEPEGPEKAAKAKKVMEEIVYPALKFIEKKAEGSKHIVGGCLSYVDLYLVEFCYNLRNMPDFKIADFKRLSSIRDSVASIPKIKKYLEERPKTDL